ncbi:MAG TPA: tRNA-dihydrouridine synthase family protein, partial [Candidatus Limnocylindria bacterium]|nr:tRNA-dihydrouridine synthase family protein [Candidatus Limnocylindria bacterium]
MNNQIDNNLNTGKVNFWKGLGNPIFALAPMEEVTDVAFREMFAKYGKPDVMYTEFVNVDGLTHEEGYKRLSLDLKYTEIQRPMVAQIWGRDPKKFFEAAQIVAKLGFDGIDINFGCPQDKEIGQKTCAALILEPELAKEIIRATMKGGGGLPVSVKTRLGYSKPEEIEVWLKHLLEVEPAAIAIHARTKQEKSKVPARWEFVKRAVEIRNELKSETLILGNGDIQSREEGLARITETGCDGVMVGRGAFGNPWFFRTDNYKPRIKERLSVMLEHASLFE